MAVIVERICPGWRDDRIDSQWLRRRSFWPKDVICGGRHNWYCGCRCYLYVRHERLVTDQTWGLLGWQDGSGNFSRHAQLDLSDMYFRNCTTRTSRAASVNLYLLLTRRSADCPLNRLRADCDHNTSGIPSGLCFQWAFAGLTVCVGLLIPESPSYLLGRGKVEQASNSFARLHRAETVEAGIQTLALTLEQENSLHQIVQETSLIGCFKDPNWRRTRIIFYANTL
jgi:hypothetical protein